MCVKKLSIFNQKKTFRLKKININKILVNNNNSCIQLVFLSKKRKNIQLVYLKITINDN